MQKSDSNRNWDDTNRNNGMVIRNINGMVILASE
jgi:hypothetical protein